jgi:hypothetical protein
VAARHGEDEEQFQEFRREIFSPSDHPTDQQRRDNYSKRLTDLSGGNVKVKDGVVYVSDKKFVKPAATSAMSSPERSYFIMGNLVAAYRTNQNAKDATVSGRTVLLGNQRLSNAHRGIRNRRRWPHGSIRSRAASHRRTGSGIEDPETGCRNLKKQAFRGRTDGRFCPAVRPFSLAGAP